MADPSAIQALPMFPLGSTLMPTVTYPLMVFEPRYLQLLADLVLTGQFGSVLIERGSEVGGRDTRTSLGVSLVVDEQFELGNSRVGITVVGQERFRVSRWLPDDPYPRADVEFIVEDPPVSGSLLSLLDDVAARVGELLELKLALGLSVVANGRPSTRNSFGLAAISGMSDLDKLTLLRLDSERERLVFLSSYFEQDICALKGR